MKMQAMDDYLVEKGFNVYRFYDGVRKEYFFDISKEGIGTSAYFKYDGQKSQEDFLDRILAKWEKEYEEFHSRPKPRPYDLYQLRRELAEHGGKAKLVVNENVYPVHINEVNIDSSAGEVPKVSVEGDLMSFVPDIVAARGCVKSEYIKEVYKRIFNSIYGKTPTIPLSSFAIEKVIFNGPATIVMWMDGTKTIVKCQDGDAFDPEKGLAMAISKKAFGNKGKYCDVFKKCLEDCDVYYETINTDPHTGDIYNAYQKLLDTLNNKKATKSDLGIAMEEAIGYLGHALG